MGDSVYIIKDAPGKGRGMFATQDIKRGTCVISEAPLVFVSPNIPKPKTLMAVDAMSKKNTKYLHALHNIFSEEELPKDIGIIRTNALPLGEGAMEGAVYRAISRINHSCAPNVRHTWNLDTQKEYIHAIEDIAAGAEILTCYIDPKKTR
ncbi:hypothetical protein BGX26_005171, partial [Mortierella sp. AD094]